MDVFPQYSSDPSHIFLRPNFLTYSGCKFVFLAPFRVVPRSWGAFDRRFRISSAICLINGVLGRGELPCLSVSRHLDLADNACEWRIIEITERYGKVQLSIWDTRELTHIFFTKPRVFQNRWVSIGFHSESHKRRSGGGGFGARIKHGNGQPASMGTPSINRGFSMARFDYKRILPKGTPW